MEEEAELALLEQRLQQTNQLASRMTSLLSQLDTRLSRLDKTIAPFGIQDLTREASNIDIALAVLSGENVRTEIIKSDFSVGKHEESIISRMPSYSDFDEYTAAINRILKEIDRLGRNDLRSSEIHIRDFSKLVDLGARNLVALLLKISREAAEQGPDMERLVRNGPSLPANILPTLPHISRILNYLGGLPRSSSHPCSSASHAALTSAKEGFLASRREYVSGRGISPIVREFDHLAEGPMSPGREEEGRRDKCRLIARAIEGLMIMIQSEKDILDQLFPSSGPKGLVTVFKKPITILNDLLAAQTNAIKRSLSTNAFYALELYQTLSGLQGRWEESIKLLLGDPELEVILAEAAAANRGACLRSFPEILVDVRTPAPTGMKEMNSSSVADITYTTVTYLENLSAYEMTVTDLLTSLGDRNWLMGAQTNQPPRSGEDDGILQHFITDLLSALIASLESRSRSMRKPVPSIYMLNNLSYMRNNLILSNQSAANDIMGSTAEDLLNSAYRDAKSKYLETWRELTGLLAEATSSSRFGGVVNVGGDKQAVKDSLSNFFNRLDELEGLSRQYTLSRQDPNLRDRLHADVRNLVVPAFQNYMAKHPKHADKYSRSSPADVENRLAALIR